MVFGTEDGNCNICMANVFHVSPSLFFRVAVEVITTETTADVLWQDGTLETNIRSNELLPIQHLDNNEFCPGDFVVDKRG